jgi:outer membrane lipoprotein-sorting protein
MSVMASRPVLRWVFPAGVLVVVLGASILATNLRASAEVNLPQRGAAQLLVDLQTAHLTGTSGTVTERANLGLPALPQGLGGDGSAQLNSLIAGSHTLRVWYSGPDKTRVALLGALGESDVIRNGTDVWAWSSADNTASHYKLTERVSSPRPTPTDLPTSPQQAAEQVLAALDPTTAVTTDANVVIAGRSAYQLAFAPKDHTSLIGKVTIALDGSAHVPLRVQIFAKSTPGTPAFEIGFSQVSFARPDAGVFAFTPPPGAKVTEQTNPSGATHDQSAAPAHAVLGTGWSAVLVTRVPAGESPLGGGPATGAQTDSLDGLLAVLPTVHGSWGSGRLLQSKLFTALLTDDGRVLVGAVPAATLRSAAADPAAALK